MNITWQFENTLLYISSGVFFNIILPSAIVPVVIIVLFAVLIFTIAGVLVKRRYNVKEREKQDLEDQLQNMNLATPVVIDGDVSIMSEYRIEINKHFMGAQLSRIIYWSP